MTSAYFTPSRPRLFGHRGSAGTHPENTLPSFLAALDSGLHYLELDVWATRDGHIVVHHDETALRMCGVNLPIRDCTLSELKQMDAGFGFSPDGGRTHPFRGQGITIPTLDEVFQACPDARLNIEIKQAVPAIESLTVEAVRRADKEDVVLLAAEQDEVMLRLRPLTGNMPTSYSRSEVAEFFSWLVDGCRSPYRPCAEALQIPETYGDRTLVTPETVAAAHVVGLEVHVWTVNRPEDMERLLSCGVDGLMSDFPSVLMETCRHHGGVQGGK